MDSRTGIELTVPSSQSRRRLERGIYENRGGSRLVILYTCSGCTPDGCPQHWETLPEGSSLQDARELRARKLADVSRGTRVVGTRVRFRAFTEEWLESVKPIPGVKGRYSPHTWDLYRGGLERHVLPTLGRKMLSELTADDCALVIRNMQKKGLKALTIRNVMKPMSVIFAAAVRNGGMATNPMLQLLPSERPQADQKTMQVLTKQEIELMLSTATPRWKPLLTTLVFTGLRISEACRLRWADVDLDAGQLTVRVAKTAAGTGREIVLMPTLVTVLKQHWLASPYKAPTDYVFANEVGAYTNPWAVRQGLAWHRKRSGLDERVTPHLLRHTFASILIGEGMDVTFVANQMGHANPGITLKVYAKLFEPAARKDEARAKLEASFGGSL